MAPTSNPTPTIYLIRHAESTHNLTKDFSLRDPGLTPTGFTQASALPKTFPHLSTIAVIISSPLRRTLETTLSAFGDLITNGDVKLILDADLQERSDLPCDTGRTPSELKGLFPGVDVAGSGLEEGWFVKEGRNAAGDEAVQGRARDVRARLAEVVKGLEGRAREGGRRDVVVVTHGVFMKFLTGDEGIDLPKAGWRGYRVEGEGEGVRLVEV
ncbi:histidine phosphatase superfamily, clade-1 [Podospora aff. communis PSN243]|uniref:Histidine phosphatase superfamily, clade-1 n=1 Tax=Podospora aff. communis PSN243 TaxID=3040156 RepID=A0AAV9GBM4_9PEZI|nr:histidine phosphatase superfamily, clade-1 [Podospora aff. communis PSN243]